MVIRLLKKVFKINVDPAVPRHSSVRERTQSKNEIFDVRNPKRIENKSYCVGQVLQYKRRFFLEEPVEEILMDFNGMLRRFWMLL